MSRWMTTGVLGLASLAIASGLWLLGSVGEQPVAAEPGEATLSAGGDSYRSPVDVALTPDGRSLLTANRDAGTVSLIALDDAGRGRVVDEISVGEVPAAVACVPGTQTALVTASYGGKLCQLSYEGGKLQLLRTLELRAEPRGMTVAADGSTAYVGLASGEAVAEVDLKTWTVAAEIAVGHWPRTLVLSRDGSRLAVGTAGERGIAVVDTKTREVLFRERFGGLNFGQMIASDQEDIVYFPWMVYRQNPISRDDISRGWVLGSRIARMRTDKHERREAITLDPQGKAVADPHGLALTSDEQWLVASAGGTHEILVYRVSELPWEQYGGPGDHIDPALLDREDRFYRFDVGGRPLNLQMAANDSIVYVANALRDAIQVVDFRERKIVQEIPLGGPKQMTLARRGEAIFYDGQRSHDQWYSCHSCHYEGDTNSVTIDTYNDGTARTYKTVLTLRNVVETKPWTWHGWQESLHEAMHKSLVDTMEGPEPAEGDEEALIAFLGTLRHPPNPHHNADGTLSAAAARGKAIFESSLAGCTTCHNGPHFTDGKLHDVGTGERFDYYDKYNTPSLRGVYNRVHYLHDGRVRTLNDLLLGPHNPARVAGEGELTEQQRADLIAYLRTL